MLNKHTLDFNLKAASSSIPRESVSSRSRVDVTGDGCAVLPEQRSGPFIYKKKIKWKRDKNTAV